MYEPNDSQLDSQVNSPLTGIHTIKKRNKM